MCNFRQFHEPLCLSLPCTMQSNSCYIPIYYRGFQWVISISKRADIRYLSAIMYWCAIQLAPEERVLFKWKQFDGYDFLVRQGKYREPRYEYSPGQARGQALRILTMPGRKRHPSYKRVMWLILNIILQSFELALLHSGQRLAKLTVFTPRRFTLLARSQNTGAQTIPFIQDTL